MCVCPKCTKERAEKHKLSKPKKKHVIQRVIDAILDKDNK